MAFEACTYGADLHQHRPAGSTLFRLPHPALGRRPRSRRRRRQLQWPNKHLKC
jgi:hypothetical protein